jgi:hypothetical protein
MMWHYNKIFIYTTKHGNIAAGRTFIVSKANVCCRRNDHASIFSGQATTKSFTGPKKGRHPDVDTVVLISSKRIMQMGCLSHSRLCK